jgi:hypothetical protein
MKYTTKTPYLKCIKISLSFLKGGLESRDLYSISITVYPTDLVPFVSI